MFLATLSASYKNEKLEDGSERVVLKLPAVLAPYKVAILPLLKKDGLPDFAKEIMAELKYDYNVTYDEKDSIGKRYRRQDAIGTPYCITIDHDSLEDKMVTLRDRDTMKQERIAVKDLAALLNEKVDMSTLLKQLG